MTKKIPIGEETPTIHMNVRLVPEEKAALDKLAAEMDRSRNWVMRYALRVLAEMEERR
jgi:predicted transcriptional regulator